MFRSIVPAFRGRVAAPVRLYSTAPQLDAVYQVALEKNALSKDSAAASSEGTAEAKEEKWEEPPAGADNSTISLAVIVGGLAWFFFPRPKYYELYKVC
jgi:hypothetical protein